MTRPAYTSTASLRDGVQIDYDDTQTAYTAGLSYFPDYSYAPSPLGDLPVGATVGTAVAGPAGGVAGSVVQTLVAKWFGGSAVDQQRLARVNYFAQLAEGGNVGAMQLILGGPPNVSGNERQMWIDAANAVRSVNPNVFNDATAAGPVWLTGSGDTATNYPAMRNYAATWAAQHPLSTAKQTITSIFTGTTPSGAPAASVSPILLYGALAAGAYYFIKRR